MRKNAIILWSLTALWAVICLLQFASGGDINHASMMGSIFLVGALLHDTIGKNLVRIEINPEIGQAKMGSKP